MKNLKLPERVADWGLGSIGMLIGGMAYMLPSLIATLTKGKAMTAMEKALGNLVALLWQRITEYEEKIEKLQEEMGKRPIQAQLDSANSRADAANREADRLRDEVDTLRKQVSGLQNAKAGRRRGA